MLPDLAKIVHGTLKSKEKIAEELNARFPDCGKSQIYKKLDEVAKKKKRESEGDTYRVAQLLPGDVFGHEALEGNQHSVGGLHKTSIKCNTPVVAICVNRDQFLQFECYKACGTQARILARGLHLPSDSMLLQACMDNRRRAPQKAKILKRHERDAAMSRARKTGDIFRGGGGGGGADEDGRPRHAEPMHFG